MMHDSTFVIAEAGVNHNGQAELAFELLETAARAGADAIKFQTFRADALVTDSAEMAEYQKTNTGQTESQHEMLARLELGADTHIELANRAKALGIEFLSTAFDSASLRFLCADVGVTKLKVASGEITNAPFLLEHGRTGLDIILSTGMATLSEIEDALGVVAYGWLEDLSDRPTSAEIKRAFAGAFRSGLLAERVTLLHCTTEYPTPPAEVNLRAMDTMREAFHLNVGYSDHTQGIDVPIAAVARGARIIEKHFTLDRSMDGPDHAASLEPDELRRMIDGIRTLQLALGDGLKAPQPSEFANMQVARKSLVAATDIEAGTAFSESNLTVKRPGDGRSPMDYWLVLGTKSQRSYRAGDVIGE